LDLCSTQSPYAFFFGYASATRYFSCNEFFLKASEVQAVMLAEKYYNPLGFSSYKLYRWWVEQFATLMGVSALDIETLQVT